MGRGACRGGGHVLGGLCFVLGSVASVLAPLQDPCPLRGGNSDLAQSSNTPARNASRSDAGGPSLRAAGFEDDDDDEDEDENEAPCEHLQPATRVQFREGASNWVDTPFLQATTFEHEHERERRTPNAKRLVVRAGRFFIGREGARPYRFISLLRSWGFNYKAQPMDFAVIQAFLGIAAGIIAYLLIYCLWGGVYTVNQNESAPITNFGRADRRGKWTTLALPIG